MFVKKVLKNFLYSLPASYVLMFHHIDDGSIVYNSRCVLDKDKFLSVLDSGLEFITIDEYVKFSRKNKDCCK